MISISADTLGTIDAFKELARPEREQIAPLCVAKSYPKSRVIITHQEESFDVFFIVSGSVRAAIYTEQGRQISYQDLFAGDMFGELAAIDHQPRSTHVVALQECTLISLSRARFYDLLMGYPQVAIATLQKTVRVVRFLCDRVYEFGALDVSGRVRAELVRLATAALDGSGSATITEMPTHQELANRLATHREAVSRELSGLEKQGLIRKQGHALVISDIRRLSSMIG